MHGRERNMKTRLDRAGSRRNKSGGKRVSRHHRRKRRQCGQQIAGGRRRLLAGKKQRQPQYREHRRQNDRDLRQKRHHDYRTVQRHAAVHHLQGCKGVVHPIGTEGDKGEKELYRQQGGHHRKQAGKDRPPSGLPPSPFVIAHCRRHRTAAFHTGPSASPARAAT